MKSKFAALCLVVSGFSASAEMFIATTNQPSLIIPTNTAVLISAIRLGNYDTNWVSPPTGSVGAKLQIANATNGLIWDIPYWADNREPRVFAIKGPAELVITNQAPVFLNYKLISGGSIESIYVTSVSTNSITVPLGKRCHFFTPINSFYNLGDSFKPPVTVASGGPPILFGIEGGEEISAPAVITLRTAPAFPAGLFSYCFTEDFESVPSVGAVAVPPGRHTITIEKSLNLTNWMPAFIQNGQSAEKAFYRFNISQ